MARTDDCPIKITSPDYKPSHQSELGDWLAKEAAGGVTPEDNEEVSTANYVEPFEDPKGRKTPTEIDGRWGETEKSPEGVCNPGTHEASRSERTGLVERVFNSLPTAEKADGDLMSQYFDHVKSGDFTTHSILLRSDSLQDKVRKLGG